MTEDELAEFIFNRLQAQSRNKTNYVDAARLNLAVIDGTFNLVAIAGAILSELSERKLNLADLSRDI